MYNQAWVYTNGKRNKTIPDLLHIRDDEADIGSYGSKPRMRTLCGVETGRRPIVTPADDDRFCEACLYVASVRMQNEAATAR